MAKTGTARPATKKARSTKPRGKSAKAASAPASVTAGRNTAIPIIGALVAGAAAAAALFFSGRSNVLATGHPAPDLEGDAHPGPENRAEPHFRPDMDAPMSAADRAALAPALATSAQT